MISRNSSRRSRRLRGDIARQPHNYHHIKKKAEVSRRPPPLTTEAYNCPTCTATISKSSGITHGDSKISRYVSARLRLCVRNLNLCVRERLAQITPRTARRRSGTRSRASRRSCVPSSGRSSRSSTGTGFPRSGTARPGRSAGSDGCR